jgi:hypothetical protein
LRPSALSHAYAWKTLLGAGVVVAGGSDAPIESCAPLVGMYDAMHRASRVDSTDVFRPEECLSFAEALGLYTTGAAAAAGCEAFMGRIAPGYFADLVILDDGVLSDPGLLRQAEPLWVVVGGRVVHTSDNISTGCVGTRTEPLALHSTGLFPGKGGPPRPTIKPTHTSYEDQKNDYSPDFTGICACRLLGRYCSAAHR